MKRLIKTGSFHSLGREYGVSHEAVEAEACERECQSAVPCGMHLVHRLTGNSAIIVRIIRGRK